jgi:hypothetical protein
MNDRIRVATVLFSIVAVASVLGLSRNRAEAATAPQQAGKSAAQSGQPPGGVNQYDPSYAWLAWQLFLRAMAPENGSLAFEAWTEQCELSPDATGCPSVASRTMATANGKLRGVHGSPLARKVAGSDCSQIVTVPVGGYPPPSNVAPNAVFCEEVYVSPAEASFVKDGLTTLNGQQAYGNAHGGVINFPGTGVNLVRMSLDSVEVKVDWVPASSFKGPTFQCPDPTHSLYTETINGTCYALVGIHITSKATPDWLWATFEPNSKVTNPNRCDPNLYGACVDGWGTTSGRPYGKGQVAQQSPTLNRAMAAAQLNPAFSNYFLTGVQTKFVSPEGKPIQLGNSFVEFNTRVSPGKSSCITCHKYAYFDGKQPAPNEPENNFGRPPHGWPSIGYACDRNQNGNCTPVVPNSTSQDFSWMLGLMPFSSATAREPTDKSHSTPTY